MGILYIDYETRTISETFILTLTFSLSLSCHLKLTIGTLCQPPPKPYQRYLHSKMLLTKTNKNIWILPSSDSEASIQHARIHMHRSSLKEYLFSKRIIDDPLCACGIVKDTDCFSLYCPLYAQNRTVLLNKLHSLASVTYTTLIYGMDSLVQDVILTTQRFKRWCQSDLQISDQIRPIILPSLKSFLLNLLSPSHHFPRYMSCHVDKLISIYWIMK